MRPWACTFALMVLTVLAVSTKAADNEPVLLPPMVVTAPPGALLFAISFQTKLPLPFSKVTGASFKQVFPGAVRDAGIKAGDILLRIDGVEVKTMTVMDMRRNIKRVRAAGTKDEFLIRTAMGEVRAVTVVYEEKKMPKAEVPEGAVPGGRG